MYCSKCGKENANGGKFCSYCGAPLETASDYGSGGGWSNQGPAQDNGGWQGSSSNQNWQNGSSNQRWTGGPGSSYGPGPSGGGGQSGLSMVLRILSLIGAVLFVLSALPGIRGVFMTLGNLIDGWIDPLTAMISLFLSLLLMASRVIMALAMAALGLCYSEERKNGEPLLMTVVLAGALVIFAAVAIPICSGLNYFIMYGEFYTSFDVVPARIGCALAAIAVPAVLIFLAGEQPFVGKGSDELLGEIQALPAILGEEIERFQSGRQSQGQSRSASTASGRAYTGGNGQYNRPEAQPNYGPRRMEDNRGLLKYIVLSLITCGIYSWYVYYTMARDINEICEGDGEETPGLAKYIIFTLLTCGIYNFVWHYKFMGRIQRNAPRYGFQVQTLGGMELNVCWLVLMAVGILASACFIGIIAAFYAMYLVFCNMNMLAKAYNEQVIDPYVG